MKKTENFWRTTYLISVVVWLLSFTLPGYQEGLGYQCAGVCFKLLLLHPLLGLVGIIPNALILVSIFDWKHNADRNRYVLTMVLVPLCLWFWFGSIYGEELRSGYYIWALSGTLLVVSKRQILQNKARNGDTYVHKQAHRHKRWK